MSTLPLIVQLMHYIIDCTVLHNRRLLYPRQFQSRSQLIRYIRVQHMLSRSCHQYATLMSACTGTVYPIWIISVCFISRPMLEVLDDRPRRRHLSFIVLIAIHVAISYSYARRESYKTIHALVRRYSLDP